MGGSNKTNAATTETTECFERCQAFFGCNVCTVCLLQLNIELNSSFGSWAIARNWRLVKTQHSRGDKHKHTNSSIDAVDAVAPSSAAMVCIFFFYFTSFHSTNDWTSRISCSIYARVQTKNPRKLALNTCVYLLRASLNFCQNEFTSIVCAFSPSVLVGTCTLADWFALLAHTLSHSPLITLKSRTKYSKIIGKDER